ncbi:MAG: hydantoinase/oxoprolinase family protein [Acidobacteria bacterium]|nr:hydantoinase/oxoprolinase family protein [Acidobacteriota bacterium]
MKRIGVDTGGTFTDLVMLDEGGLRVHKVRSTPDDPSRAIVAGLRELAGDVHVEDVVHGSTVATNAVLERKGARVVLVATRGFEDVLRIGRQTRRELYNFLVLDRQPIVEPGDVVSVAERLSADGGVVESLAEAEVERVAAAVSGLGAESVAVCLLHSYANPAHEARLAARLEADGLTVSASHRVLPEYREFERWSTTAVNAYVTPLMARYLARLEERLGAGTRLSIMQSNGGSISAAAAKAAAVQTILSGPAAGAVGAHAVAVAAGFSRAIGFDMGGTSTDVTLVDGGLAFTTESVVGECPVRVPMIDIHTVGAGGGSIAFVDTGGALRVGPRSAGADPGPVCYGTGDEVTVTDANLLLGRLDPGTFLGGRMTLDAGRATARLAEFAARVGLSPVALAEGIVRIANANMERAIRVVSVERGHDPRDFALVAFGGAGGMHACDLAAALDIATVIVPRHAGVLSALGMLLSDVTRDYSHTLLRRADTLSPADVDEALAPLVARAVADLAREGFSGQRVRLERGLDVRYLGQAYEIAVPWQSGYREEFDRRHERLYGYANRSRPVEVVNVRVKAVGVTLKPSLPHEPVVARDAVPMRCQRAVFGGRPVDTPVYHREALTPGHRADGPAVVAGAEATTVVPPGFAFHVDDWGNLMATRLGRRSR